MIHVILLCLCQSGKSQLNLQLLCFCFLFDLNCDRYSLLRVSCLYMYWTCLVFACMQPVSFLNVRSFWIQLKCSDTYRIFLQYLITTDNCSGLQASGGPPRADKLQGAAVKRCSLQRQQERPGLPHLTCFTHFKSERHDFVQLYFQWHAVFAYGGHNRNTSSVFSE